MRKWMILLALLVVADATVYAGPPRRYRQRHLQNTIEYVPSTTPVRVVEEQPATSSIVQTEASSTKTETNLTGSDDALDEVNAERARRGLKPFLPDPLLNKAALACARQRSARGIHGHLPESDFSYLPAGAQATSAGCGALEPSWGWGTCCTYDNYTYAGAAWVMGADGRRYMHLFVR